jgi:hypothetical protein
LELHDERWRDIIALSLSLILRRKKVKSDGIEGIITWEMEFSLYLKIDRHELRGYE